MTDLCPVLSSLIGDVATAHGGKVEWGALSGGVLNASCTLPADKYEAVKAWLIEHYGQPEVLKPWHPAHTKGVAPLRFKTGCNNIGDHINLISMMQRADRRYVLVSSC